MTAHRIAGYGAWSSPITSDFVVAETIGLADLRVAGGVIYWIEARPTENGRNVLVRQRADGTIEDVTPPPWNVRTRVHEYGGASYVVAGETVFFSNFADQRLHRLDPGGAARPFSTRADVRYADGRFDARRNRLILIRGDHAAAGPSAVLPMAAEFAAPLWNLGTSFYAFIGRGEIACAVNENGIWSLGIVSEGGALRRLATPFQDCGFVNAIDGAIVCRAGAPQSPAAILRVHA